MHQTGGRCGQSIILTLRVLTLRVSVLRRGAQAWSAYRCAAGFLSGLCPLWVISRHHTVNRLCPLYPQKRTLSATTGMSVLCHVWTAPSWQGFSSRLQAGRCSHVFGLFARHTRPLAIMPSADQVPVKSPHSTMHWHMWVILIAGSTGSALRAVRPPNLHITPDCRRDLGYAASRTRSL